MPWPDLSTARVGIWGFGLEGRAVLDVLAPAPAPGVAPAPGGPGPAARPGRGILVVDERAVPDTAERPGVEYAWGPAALDRLRGCDLVVVSPGIPRTHPFLDELAAAGTTLTTGSALWLESNAGRTVGITGTKGKSTTASLVHAILAQAGPAVLAGNIGLPLLAVPAGAEPVVAELSSYQCSWITRSPRIAVVTNLYEEHLPWHGGVERYWRDKARIATHGADVLVCDAPTMDKLRSVDERVDAVRHLEIPGAGASIDGPDGRPVITVGELPLHLRARHLVGAVRAAVLAAAAATGAVPTAGAVAAGLAGYTPLPHRQEVVAHAGGMVWVDDTLSTTAESVVAAVEAFRAPRVILIVGGQDRGISYRPLTDFLLRQAGRVEVVTIPSNGPSAVAEFAQRHPGRVHSAADLPGAVRAAARLGSPGAHVILSPGAPSYDFFTDYRQKGAVFRAAVDGLDAADLARAAGHPE